jgi:hypothetical protein
VHMLRLGVTPVLLKADSTAGSHTAARVRAPMRRAPWSACCATSASSLPAHYRRAGNATNPSLRGDLLLTQCRAGPPTAGKRAICDASGHDHVHLHLPPCTVLQLHPAPTLLRVATAGRQRPRGRCRAGHALHVDECSQACCCWSTLVVGKTAVNRVCHKSAQSM